MDLSDPTFASEKEGVSVRVSVPMSPVNTGPAEKAAVVALSYTLSETVAETVIGFGAMVNDCVTGAAAS